MKALFADDHRFIPYRDRVLSEGQFPSQYWDMYLSVFDSLVVIGRSFELPADRPIKDLNRSDRSDVTFRLVPSLTGLRAQLCNQKTVRNIVSREVASADAVIARLPSENGLVAIRSARSQGTPYAVNLVECPWDALWNYGSLRAKAYAPIMWFRTRLAVGNAPFVMYVTEEFLQSRYPAGEGHSIACSDVNLDSVDREILEKRLLSIRDGVDRLTIGMIASLHGEFKGIQTAFKALAIIGGRLPEWRLRILGQGEPRRWRQLASELGIINRVQFDGTLPSGSPVMEWLDQVDLYLQPSFKEGLPRALIEAMSRGCPCIGSTTGGIPELLDEDVLHSPGDYRYLGQLIESARNKQWMREQAIHNWHRAQDFSAEVLKEKRHSFWEMFRSYVKKASHYGS